MHVEDRTVAEKFKESVDRGTLAPLWMAIKIGVGLFLVYFVFMGLAGGFTAMHGM